MSSVHQPTLIRPCADLEETYRELIQDFQKLGEPLIPWVLKLEADRFGDLIGRLDGYSRGIGIPDGFVESSS